MTGNLNSFPLLWIFALEINNLIVIFNLESKFNTEVLKATFFYLRSFLNAKYENQLDIFVNYNGQVCKKYIQLMQQNHFLKMK